MVRCLCLASCLATTAFAADSGAWRTRLPAEARRLDQEGRRQYSEKAWAGCAESFSRAYALSKEPRLLWNAAACERKLGNNLKALSVVEQYLAEGSGQLSSADEREAQDALLALQKLVAQVKVTADAPDARLRVDGADRGPLTGAPVWLSPGEHSLEVVAEGHQSATRPASALAAGQTVEWSAHLAPVARAEPPNLAPSPDVLSGSTALAQAAPAPAINRTGPVVLGVGAIVAVAAGAILVGTSRGTYSSLSDSCSPLCSPDSYSAAQRRETAGFVMVGVGSAALAGAVAWWVGQSLTSSSAGTGQ